MARIAIFQSRTGIDPAANARSLVQAMHDAAAQGAAMLFTPEMSGLLDRNGSRAADNIRSEEDDRVLAACREEAAAKGLWLHIGSLAVRVEGGKIANRGFVIDADGAIRARYDKIHLFDVDLLTGESWRESAVYSGGSEAVIIEGTPVGKLGLSICYDLRFPALFASLSEAGADVIAVPAAFTVPTGRAHWAVLLRARAIEAALFVVAAAQSGVHEDGRETYGHSALIDPWGDVLLDMGEEAGLAVGEVDLQRIQEVRSRIPALKHRVPISPAAVR
ncbi:MAG: carbon-nitrogen hydrolase family protein [Pseudomonadota bacterium]|nr:carbon-nitrogen hydrolase family protein [Pseudomonadota bacterium]